jgi:hypothetical protein
MSTPYLYGSNAEDAKLQDVLKLKSKQFSIDMGAQAAGTDTTETFSKGDMVLGFSAVFTELVSTGSSPTVSLGFSGTEMVSAVTAAATLVVDYPLGPDQTAAEANGPYVLPADDTFDCIVATATLTTGKCDVTVWYIEAPAFEAESQWVTA